MKNQLILGLAVLMSAIQMQAQQSVADDNLISASGTQFATPVTDPKWSNDNGVDFTKASYREYSGETSVTLSAATAIEARITVDADVAKGILKVSMTGNDEIVFQQAFAKDGQYTVTTKLEPGVSYIIKFAGIRTKGAYFCQWKPITYQPNQQ